MDDLLIKQSAQISAAIGTARAALVEVAKLAGKERLDQLEAEFLSRAKNTPVEGVPLELEMECLNIVLATVKLIFAQARDRAD